MSSKRSRALLCLSLAIPTLCCAQGDGAKIFANSKGAIVTINTPTGAGTGFVCGDGSLLVTAAHVIGDEMPANIRSGIPNVPVIAVLARDVRRDIAILKLGKATAKKLSFSLKTPAPGSKVYVIGSSLGFLTNTISEGIVGALRSREGVALLQITAPISNGNSGGPVFDTSGKVVGIVQFSIEEGQLLNFAATTSEVRTLIASLGPNPDPVKIVKSLIPKLYGPPDDVYKVQTRLKDFGPVAVPLLIAALTHENLNICSQAAQALGAMGDKRAIEPLMKALSEEDATLRGKAAVAIAQLRDPRAFGILMKMMRGPEPTKSWAVRGLGYLRDKRAVQPLIDLLGSETDNELLICWTIEALGQIGDRAAFDTLLKKLDPSEGSMARGSAATALGDLGDPRAIEPLLEALENDAFVTYYVALAFAKMPHPDAVEPLSKHVDDTQADTRKAVAMALGEIGGQQAFELLQGMLGDKDNAVRNAARAGLQKIARRRR